MKRLTDYAKVIRSKNAGPFILTLDILFREKETYKQIRALNVFTREVIATLYKTALENVVDIIWFPPAYGVKVIMKRSCFSGGPGDRDVYGAQQHAPLMAITIPDLGREVRHAG